MDNRFYERGADENRYFNFHKALNNFVSAHYHSNIEILFIAKGKVNVSVNGQETLLDEGCIAVFHHFEVHYIDGFQDSEVYVLVFSNLFWPENLRGKRFGNFLYKGEGTVTVFSMLEYLLTLPYWDNVVLQTGIVHLLLGTLAHYYPVYDEDKNSKRDAYVSILVYIDEHYTEQLSLENIASKFGYEKHYFSQLFNRFVGMHLREYINRLRIERVNRERQENPDKPISEIIYGCGFSSLNTYYRAVKLFQGGSFGEKK